MKKISSAFTMSALFLLSGMLCLSLFPSGEFTAGICAIIALIILLPILTKMIWDDVALGKKQMNELVLIAVVAAMLQGHYMGYLTAGFIAFFLTLSILIERRAAKGARIALESVTALTLGKVRVVTAGEEAEKEVEFLQKGDIIRIRAGEVIGADGVITLGKSAIQESNITGESLPLDKEEGENVYAGTLNLSGVIEVKVEKIGSQTALGKVKELITQAELTRPNVVRLMDACARFYTPMILIFAFLVFIAFDYDWNRVVTLLVASCPIALVLSTPSSAIAALSAAARLGIFIKKISDLETLSHVETFIFDKTGTLTCGELEVIRLVPEKGIEAERLLKVALTASEHSNHPISKAIVAIAKKVHLTPYPSYELYEKPGRGMRCKIENEWVVSGNQRWLDENHVICPTLEDETQLSMSILYIAQGGVLLGYILLQDQLRRESIQVIDALRSTYHIDCVMVTGDREGAAKYTASKLGISTLFFECKPSDKVTEIQNIKLDGKPVVFVGDGVNDGPALAVSDIGIAMGAKGQTLALETATMALMNNNLERLLDLKILSLRYRQVLIQNLVIGFIIIIAGFSLAMFMPQRDEGIMMYGALLSALMQLLGALAVVFNSARLLK